MGALIHLIAPVPAVPDASRPYYAVGRGLSASDFAQQSRYADARLLGLTPKNLGVISGLGVSPARYDVWSAQVIRRVLPGVGPGGRPLFAPELGVSPPHLAPASPAALAAAVTPVHEAFIPAGPVLPVFVPPSPPNFTVAPGTGIGADGRLVRLTAPLTFSWPDLLQSMTPRNTIADGVYLLILRTVQFDGVDGPPPDASAGAGGEPLLDIRQDSFVELSLSASIGPLPTMLTAAGAAFALNTLIAGLSQQSLEAAIGAGVQIALVMTQNNQLLLLSQAAGRVAAAANPMSALLLAQAREVLELALNELGGAPTADAWATITPRFGFLPGACELPLSMLKGPAEVNPAGNPSCPFLPPGVGVYLQIIPSSQTTNLLTEALGRPPINLTNIDGPAVTLSLAVPDAIWAPNLLDDPFGDPILPADLHFAYARALVAQAAWLGDWVALYGGMTSAPTNFPQEIAFLIGADAAAQNLSYLLTNSVIKIQDLLTAASVANSPNSFLPLVTGWLNSLKASGANLQPPLPPAPLPPVPPAPSAPPNLGDAPHLLASLGYQVIDPEPTQPNVLPVSSDGLLSSANIYPADWIFALWIRAIRAPSPNPALLQPLIDAGVISANPATQTTDISTFLALVATSAGVIDDTQPGALLQLAIAQLFYAILGRVARAQEYVLDAHSRLIALQRQHLDMMSTYISAVAGGTPSDASGLGVTRILPFFNFSTTTTSPTTALAPAGSSGAVARTMEKMAVPAAQMASLADASQASATFARSTSTSQVAKASISDQILSGPKISLIGNLFGNQTDIAATVAAETNALSQAPQFSYSPVQYGTAAHITPGSTLYQTASDGLKGLRALMGQSPIGLTPSTLLPPFTQPASSADPPTQEMFYYNGVIQTTRTLLGDITQVENNAINVEANYMAFRDRLQSLEALISQLTAAVASARDALRAAQAASAKAAGDYAAAQTLVAEETARVTAAVQARNQAIAAATGLFMLRQLQTVIARDPPATLSLTADTPADLAPGCLADHPGPPASLTPFLDLLLETPLANWTSLAGGWTGLPDNSGLQRLSGLRAARLVNFAPSANFGGGAAASDLANLATSTRSVIDPVLRNTFSIGPSLALNQQAAFAVFSLPDLITLPANALRTNAESLRASMESATGCLYQMLLGLPPSARFAWATLARAGTLPTLSFMQWPLPDGPTAATTTALRQLSALVTWMAGQLTDGASAAAQTALGNLVGAAVIASAYGDPNEAVSGTVVSTGGVPLPGLPIRITLNRPPPIGTLLNLFDANQNIVGTLRVQDHDAYGTSATVVTSFATTAPNPNWTVASQGDRSPWLAS